MGKGFVEMVRARRGAGRGELWLRGTDCWTLVFMALCM